MVHNARKAAIRMFISIDHLMSDLSHRILVNQDLKHEVGIAVRKTDFSFSTHDRRFYSLPTSQLRHFGKPNGRAVVVAFGRWCKAMGAHGR